MNIGNINLNIGEIAIIVLGVAIVLSVLALIFAAALKGKKKGLVVLFLIISSVMYIGSSLIYNNIIPLSLHLGYFQEVYDYNYDGKKSGLKFTISREFSYTSSYDPSYEFRDESKGKAIIAGSYLRIEHSKDYYYEFEIKDFGRSLYSKNGECVYKYVKDIGFKV